MREFFAGVYSCRRRREPADTNVGNIRRRIQDELGIGLEEDVTGLVGQSRRHLLCH